MRCADLNIERCFRCRYIDNQPFSCYMELYEVLFETYFRLGADWKTLITQHLLERQGSGSNIPYYIGVVLEHKFLQYYDEYQKLLVLL